MVVAGCHEHWILASECGPPGNLGGIFRQETLAAFIEAYQTKGYTVCGDESLEQGYEKIAIFAKGPRSDEPTHAAKQLSSGKWTSKLGQAEDIEHDTLSAVEGPVYGRAVVYMKRPL